MLEGTLFVHRIQDLISNNPICSDLQGMRHVCVTSQLRDPPAGNNAGKQSQ